MLRHFTLGFGVGFLKRPKQCEIESHVPVQLWYHYTITNESKIFRDCYQLMDDCFCTSAVKIFSSIKIFQSYTDITSLVVCLCKGQAQ
jgi:hypothetical protein